MQTNLMTIEREQIGISKNFSADIQAARILETKIKTFAKEDLAFLKKKNKLVYFIRKEQTINSQLLAGRPFWYIINENLSTPSRGGDTAFNPNPYKFILPKSTLATFPEQQEMVQEYSYKLQKEYGSNRIKAIIGNVVDYTSLVFQHLDTTKAKGKTEYLFGEDKKDTGVFFYTSTTNLASNSRTIDVGGFTTTPHGLSVGYWNAHNIKGSVGVAPLIVLNL